MKPKLICCCSSRQRPDRIKEMLNSFMKTKTPGLSKLIVYIDEKDPRIDEYGEVIKEFTCSSIQFIVGKHKYMVAVINYIATEVYPNAEYYQNICDDHVYIKKGWDKLMIKPMQDNGGWGVSWILDKRDPSNNPTADIISGKIIKILGYFYPPKFRQAGCELVFALIGEHTGYYFCGKDIIEHHCHVFGYSKPDGNTDFVYSSEEKENAVASFHSFVETDEISKIKKQMILEGRSYKGDPEILKTIWRYY